MQETGGSQRIPLPELLDVLPVPVVVYGVDGQVLLANRASVAFMGHGVKDFEAAITRTRPSTEDGEPIARDRLAAVRALSGETIRGERQRVRAADGHEEVCLVNAAPLRDERGAVVAAVVVFSDITDLSELERDRRELFGMANHDLRTPLTVILGFVQLARRVAPRDPARAIGLFDDIERQTLRMIRLVRDLLDVARFETGAIPVEPAPGDLSESVRAAVARQPESRPIALDLPDGPVRATFDADRIDQVLDNLLSNALRHTAAGTTVEMRLTVTEDEVVLRVTDHGGGVAPEELPKLFRPFHQTPRGRSFGGTGLGLYISRRIAEAHGGRLWLEESGPAGTTFSFALPRARGLDEVR